MAASESAPNQSSAQIKPSRNAEDIDPDSVEIANQTPSEQNGNIINVHQHFNQPNIMNFNHNEYFDKFNKLAKNGEIKSENL
jgi:hypothetical protein